MQEKFIKFSIFELKGNLKPREFKQKIKKKQ